VHDQQAAVCLWLRGDPIPRCGICQKELVISKKYRNYVAGSLCGKHVNSTIVTAEQIHQSNIHNFEIVKLPVTLFSSSQIQLKCATHGEFSVTIAYLLKQFNCGECYHVAQKGIIHIDFAQWSQESSRIHSGKYKYTSHQFHGTSHDTEIECPVHGLFWQNAGVHRRGHGCNRCAHDHHVAHRMTTAAEFITKAHAVHNNKYDYSHILYAGSRKKIQILCPTHGMFEQVAYYHLAGNGCQQCGFELSSFKSKPEYDIIDFLKSLGISNIVHSWRELNFELDIYLPDFQIAIEFDGIYWHSSDDRTTDLIKSRKHVQKTQMCDQHGIQLFHIIETEWNDSTKQQIWKSMLRHKLKKSPSRVFARNTHIQYIDHKTASEFFNQNHLQGSARSEIRIALCDQSGIVAVGSFAKSRFTADKSVWELIRFAVRRDHAVPGAFTKILADFRRTNKQPLVSYANRRWSQGNVYEKSGFRVDHVAKPCYYYTDCKTLWHRSVFQKHKLADRLDNFDHAKTEVQNMYDHGYRRIWDCGNIVTILDEDKNVR